MTKAVATPKKDGGQGGFKVEKTPNKNKLKGAALKTPQSALKKGTPKGSANLTLSGKKKIQKGALNGNSTPTGKKGPQKKQAGAKKGEDNDEDDDDDDDDEEAVGFSGDEDEEDSDEDLEMEEGSGEEDSDDEDGEEEEDGDDGDDDDEDEEESGPEEVETAIKKKQTAEKKKENKSAGSPKKDNETSKKRASLIDVDTIKKAVDSNLRLFLGNISFTTTNEELRAHLETIVSPSDIVDFYRLQFKKNNPGEEVRYKHFGYITLKSGEAAQKILQLDGKEVLGRALKVDKAHVPSDSPRKFAERKPGGKFNRPGGPGGQKKFGGKPFGNKPQRGGNEQKKDFNSRKRPQSDGKSFGESNKKKQRTDKNFKKGGGD